MAPRLRRAAGIGLALYAVCVFPANIQHVLDSLGRPDAPLSGWRYHGPRLMLQPVIVWWALWAGEVIDWPFVRGASRFKGRNSRPPTTDRKAKGDKGAKAGRVGRGEGRTSGRIDPPALDRVPTSGGSSPPIHQH